jgi:TfoX/Sxy family transcriptional regulator of competence genes
MPYGERLAKRVRSLLARRKGFTEKKMFGGVGFLLAGNMCVGVWKEFLILRLGADAYEAALDEEHVRQFDITGRPMTGWVMVAPEGCREVPQLKAWLERAVAFVRTLPAKQPGKSGKPKKEGQQPLI